MLLSCERCGIVFRVEDEVYFKKRMANGNLRKTCNNCGHRDFEVAI